jgi:hypothetical protein
MKNKTFAIMAAFICLCTGMAWSQKSISNVYQMDVIVATNSISPETTSMLYIQSGIIAQFDGKEVFWESTTSGNTRRGIIISSGLHTMISGRRNGWVGPVILVGAGSYDFRPGGFYQIDFDNNKILITDLTNNVNWSPEKRQMEQIIQGNTTPGQTAQGSQTARATQSGLPAAVDRASKTLMDNLQQGDSIAIISITGENADYVRFELEEVLVNNRFNLFDRTRLDEIRREQNFQLTGDVDESTAVQIGKLAGVKAVIIGGVTGSGDLRSLRLRALNAQTGQFIAAGSAPF